MKNFRDFLKEEVLPTVQVADGGLDISKPAVRAAMNAAIAGVVSQPAVTPYVVFNRLSKLLAQYHIVLPKRFLEGDKGVEVFELRQFGHKMGMTDSGEFVNEVPSTHYLFLQYGILTPFGITYAKPVVGGMFKVMARIVDKEELDKLIDMAEITMSEEAEVNQAIAKANAPREPMCDITSDEKKVGNKQAVAASEKKNLDEEKKPKPVNLTPQQQHDKTIPSSMAAYREKIYQARLKQLRAPRTDYSKNVSEDKDPCWKGYEMIGMKKKGGREVPNCVPKEETQISELNREQGSMINRYIGKTTDNPKREKGRNLALKKKWGDKEFGLPEPKVKAVDRSVNEMAPPGAKFKRMAKHIKAGYAKDGLTDVEKRKAFGATWKAYKKSKIEEGRVEIDKKEYNDIKTKHSEASKKNKYGVHADTNHVYRNSDGHVVHQTWAHEKLKIPSIEHTPSTDKYHKFIDESAGMRMEEGRVEDVMKKPEKEHMKKIAKHAIAHGADIKKLSPRKKKVAEENQLDELHGKGSIEKIAAARHKKIMTSRATVPDSDNPHFPAHDRAVILKHMRTSKEVSKEVGKKKDISYPTYRELSKAARAEQKKRENLEETSEKLRLAYTNKAMMQTREKEKKPGEHWKRGVGIHRAARLMLRDKKKEQSMNEESDRDAFQDRYNPDYKYTKLRKRDLGLKKHDE